ncbi:hypothetical protein LUZ60_004956 [Juncus effusus]|nr:hypothetical protein LUZ60_004956 [Juncus effusus]
MSCNGCRVLRKGCSDSCVLRSSIEWIEIPKAQAHATSFVAKFFGRAALISSLSSVPEPHRPALFRSLLYEACGRTISPVSGGVGLMWSGNWHMCEAAVDTILCGGSLQPVKDNILNLNMSELYGPIVQKRPFSPNNASSSSSDQSFKRKRGFEFEKDGLDDCDLGLCLMAKSTEKSSCDESDMTSGDSTADKKPVILTFL